VEVREGEGLRRRKGKKKRKSLVLWKRSDLGFRGRGERGVLGGISSILGEADEENGGK